MDGVKRKYRWVVFSALAAIGGIYFTGVGGSYLVDYLKDTPDNPYREEYLQGVALSLMFSFPFWLLLAAFVTPLKSSVPKSLFILLRAPAIVLGSAFVVIQLFIIVMVFIDKFPG